MKGRTILRLTALGGLVILLSALSLLGACGDKEVIKEVPVEKVVEKEVVKEVPVEKVVVKEVPAEVQEVLVGTFWDLSGPYAAVHSPAAEGQHDVFRWVNEHGGLNGVRIKYHLWDHQEQAKEYIAGYEDFLAKGCVMISTSSSFGDQVLKEKARADQMLVASIGSAKHVVEDPGWMFVSNTGYVDQATAWLQYFLDNMWEGSGKPKVGFIGMDAPAGRTFDNDDWRNYVRNMGMELIEPLEFIPTVAVDTSPSLLRLKNSGVDVLVCMGVPATIVPVVNDMDRLGMKIPWGAAFPLMIEEWIEMVGNKADGLGHYVGLGPTWDKSAEGIQLMKDMQMEYHKKITESPSYGMGTASGLIMTEALRLTLEKVPFEELTSETIRKYGFMRMKYDLKGMGIPVDFTTGAVYGPDSAGYLKKVEDGKVSGVDWLPLPDVENLKQFTLSMN